VTEGMTFTVEGLIEELSAFEPSSYVMLYTTSGVAGLLALAEGGVPEEGGVLSFTLVVADDVPEAELLRLGIES